MIEFRNVTKIYGEAAREVVALRNVSLIVEPGEFIAITGPSGCGKSTLLHLTCGLDLPTSGEVLVEGQSTAALTDDQLTLMRRRRIGLVFQAFNLIPTLTALENVVLPATLDGRSFASQLSAGRSLLEAMDLTQRADEYPDQLSGGEVQRVAIARALIMDPTILLADEPTGNLDSESGASVIELIERFSRSANRGDHEQAKRIALIVTHDEAIASRAARRVRLKDGTLV